jgi:hypothetical protein|tara:strand:+ start:1394 stop:1513 length:120 start_codon:yes stop_codon:yes gene_type:complete
MKWKNKDSTKNFKKGENLLESLYVAKHSSALTGSSASSP